MQTLALVGCAHIHTPGFVNRLQARGDVRVKYTWDPVPAKAQKNAAALGATAVESATTIWRDKEVTAVVICSETNRHRGLVRAACASGKHLFVEKPLGMGAADAYAMAAAIEEAGVLFQTGYFMRGLPVNQFLKAQIGAGAFGKITRIRGSNCHHGSLAGWFDTEWRWMADPSLAGCGAFGDLGTHALDIMLWLMGNPARVTGRVAVVTGRYAECDESGEAMLSFPDGAVGTLAAGWVDLSDPVSLQISGTEGHAVVIDGQLYFKSNQVAGADGQEVWTDLPAALPHAFDLFLDASGGGATAHLVGATEAAVRSAVMAAIYKGAARTAWVAPRLPAG
jgi:predicted dehydrogenase